MSQREYANELGWNLDRVKYYLRKMKTQIAVPLCVFLLSLFMIDQVYSFINPNTGHGITDYISKIYIETNSSVRG